MADKEESKEVVSRDADFFDVPFNGESTALALRPDEDDSPMESMRVIFEEIRDGINTLVDLTMNMGPSAADLRDENLGDSDVQPEAPPAAEGGGGFPKFEIPKVGPKFGLLLMLAGLTLLFKYGDEIAAVLEPILKKAKEFYDNLSPNGKIGLGFAALAAVMFPGTLLKILKTGLKVAFKLLKKGFTTMKDAIKSMPGLMKSGYMKGKELLGGAFGKLKGGFNTLKGFITDKMIPGIKNAAGKGKDGIMFVVNKIKGAFNILKAFMLKSIIPGISKAAGGVGGLFMKAVTGVTAAFTVVRTFMMATLIPAITAMLGPFAIPLGLVVLAVAAAVAIFVSIKAGIDEFKQSLADGDGMLVAIIEGVSTALLTLVFLPQTLIKNFVAWVAEKLGFEGIAEKLREFSIVDFIKDSIKTLVMKAVGFITGLFDIDFGAVLGKFIDIGKSIMLSIKAIGAGALGAAKGFLSPVKNFKKAYNAYMEKNKLPDEVAEIEVENEEDYKKSIRSMDDVHKEELIENKEKLDELAYMDPDKVLESGNDVEGEIMELEMRNDALYEMIGDKLDTSNEIAIENAKIMMSIANSTPTPVIINNNNKTENNQNDNTSIVSDIAVDHQDKTADALANSN